MVRGENADAAWSWARPNFCGTPELLLDEMTHGCERSYSRESILAWVTSVYRVAAYWGPWVSA